MVHAPIVVRVVGAALALTLPVACGSSGGPSAAPVSSPPVSASPSAPTLTAGLVANTFYAFVHPRAPGEVISRDTVMFTDLHHATLRAVVFDAGPTEHDQLEIAGDQMTFSHASAGGLPCATSDVGVYHFTVAGDVLRFQVVKDTCSLRKLLLVGHDLTLSPYLS